MHMMWPTFLLIFEISGKAVRAPIMTICSIFIHTEGIVDKVMCLSGSTWISPSLTMLPKVIDVVCLHDSIGLAYVWIT